MQYPHEIVENAVKNIRMNRSRHDEFCVAMRGEHRTEQQDFTALCVRWLEHIAQYDWHDDRNKASVELAKAFIKNIEPKLRAMPRI